MVWICDAGNLDAVVAYCMVSLSFLILRKKNRICRVRTVFRHTNLLERCGSDVRMYGACYCIPGSGGTLVWQEWLMVGGWSLLGVYFAVCKFKYKEKFGSLIELISDEDAAS